ncbi:MAG: UDP-N-acetylmuramoyl-L-alanine--D-glutamate ligase [Micrococcales bacterium]|nr:UDP-N-acetylmuramoyl-L-alanine--D-glutamate ligase [Micrococcales bacterium]
MQVELVGAQVLVAGLGTSGRAALAALRAADAVVTTYDDHADDAQWHRPDDIDPGAYDLVVASPGLPPHHGVLAGARGANVPVVSEVELAWWLRAERDGHGRAPWLAVTGTNGKTTTVGMLEAVLAAAGERVVAVGNVGTPVVQVVTDPDLDVLAVELSSFQLHFTSSVAAQAAAVLNIAPDHLDWHGSLDAYAADKARIWNNADAVVYNADDPATVDLLGQRRGTGFTLGRPGPGQLGVVDGTLVDRQDVPVELAQVADMAHLAGPDGVVAAHVVADALAAAALARAHGVEPRHVRAGLAAFTPGAHRVVTVAQVGDVAFVDDSKATNAHAAAASLGGCAPGSAVWIAGGLAKGATFDDLVAARADRLRAVVLIGTDRTPWRHALARHAPQVPVIEVDDPETGTVMTRAVAAAHRLATDPALGSGPVVVLLAPASASMDQFASYADRGDRFAEAAHALAHHT